MNGFFVFWRMNGIHGPRRERKDVLVGTQNRTGPDYVIGLRDKTHLQVMRGRLWRFWRISKARQKSLDLLWALGSHEKVSMEKQTEKTLLRKRIRLVTEVGVQIGG